MPPSEVSRQLSTAEELGDLRAYGDQMQSALSRVLEWADEPTRDMPYEVRMAVLEGKSVDFRIENEPRYVVSGTVKDWRGERSLDDEELDHHEIASLFEDPPECADLRVRTRDLEPPLPPEVASLHVGMPYGAFRRLRDKIAGTIGLDLDMMWGFRPSRAPKPRSPEPSRQRPLACLVPFLYHSDCDGDLSPDECRTVAPALADAIGRMVDEALLEMIEACATYDRRLLFR